MPISMQPWWNTEIPPSTTRTEFQASQKDLVKNRSFRTITSSSLKMAALESLPNNRNTFSADLYFSSSSVFSAAVIGFSRIRTTRIAVELAEQSSDCWPSYSLSWMTLTHFRAYPSRGVVGITWYFLACRRKEILLWWPRSSRYRRCLLNSRRATYFHHHHVQT